ncbi:MAG TPA: iron-sulfur cluster assembly scaffold protein [Candidatus Binatia bacterium]|nr:iron-sulfur cluster assembly scaffold protein [Candidatus Binatia bacterium]
MRPERDADPFGYGRTVWELFRAAPRSGRLEGALEGRANTPANRSVLVLHLKMAQGRVADARFQAHGCPTTIAVGAWLAQRVLGHTPAELERIAAPMIREALEIGEARAHCALLGEDAVKAALAKAGTA